MLDRATVEVRIRARLGRRRLDDRLAFTRAIRARLSH
jgi:hypothetical protein